MARLISPINEEVYTHIVNKYMLLCTLPEMDEIKQLHYRNEKLKRKKGINALKQMYKNTLTMFDLYEAIYSAFEKERIMEPTAYSLVNKYFQGIFADLQCRLYKQEIILTRNNKKAI